MAYRFDKTMREQVSAREHWKKKKKRIAESSKIRKV